MLQLLINKKPLNLAMAPKKASAKKAAADKKSGRPGRSKAIENEPTKEESEEENNKALQQGLLNNLKNAKKRIEEGRPQPGDENKVELLQKYQSLDRYSSTKKDLLNKWKADRSVGWWRSYEDSSGSEYKEVEDGVKGYGSRR